MSLVICVLTVMSVDWVTNEKQSVPMRIPCEGFDHITRLEIISTTTEAEYQQLETVLYGQMGSYERPSNNMVEKDPKVGPKRMGNHYSDMFEEAKQVLSQRDTVRTISITERVAYDDYGGVAHLYDRLIMSSYHVSSDKNAILMNQTSSNEQESMLTMTQVLQGPVRKGDGIGVVEPDVVNVRVRRAGDVNVNSEITSHVENKNEQSDSSTKALDKTTTGGGYGSQTCTSTSTELWNNSNFTNGQCRCECPFCDTQSLHALIKDANAERSATLSKLETCQTQLYTSPTVVGAKGSDGRLVKCKMSEFRRLKEETRKLRARMRRRIPTVPSPSDSVTSKFTSSLETLGGSMVMGAANLIAGGADTRKPGLVLKNHQSLSPTVSSPSVSGKTSSVVTQKTTGAASTVSRSKQHRTRLVNSGRNKSPVRASRSRPRKASRGRRSPIEGVRYPFPVRRLVPWLQVEQNYDVRHFVNSRRQVGDGAHFINYRPHVLDKSRDVMYNHTGGYQPQGQHGSRRRRDMNQSHFSGSTNSAFTNASFHGSSEHHVDNSENVRTFNPVVSPKVELNHHGKNETTVQESHNGNDINIVTTTPCKCTDGLSSTMWAIWMQLSLSVILTLGLLTYLYLRHRSAYSRKAEARIAELQSKINQQTNRLDLMTTRTSTLVVSDVAENSDSRKRNKTEEPPNYCTIIV